VLATVSLAKRILIMNSPWLDKDKADPNINRWIVTLAVVPATVSLADQDLSQCLDKDKADPNINQWIVTLAAVPATVSLADPDLSQWLDRDKVVPMKIAKKAIMLVWAIVSLADLDLSNLRLDRVRADPSNRAKAAVAPTVVSLADLDLSQ